jgi:hypothetical protein
MKKIKMSIIKNGWEFVIKYIIPIVQIFIVGFTVLLTYYLIQESKKSAEISEHVKNAEQFRTTREMCYDFNDRYWMYDHITREKHSIHLDFLHFWTYPTWKWETNSDTTLNVWNNMPDTLKLKSLITNIELNRVLDYFEDAKKMDESGYLDTGYFYNFFVTTVKRLVNAKHPTFIEYIDAKRGCKYDSNRNILSVENVFIWDGFDYCLINIFIPLSKKIDSEATSNLLNDYWSKYLKKYEKERGGDNKIEKGEKIK